jgi:hypothetical protein
MTMRAPCRLAAALIVALAAATPVAALAALAPPSPLISSCAAAGTHRAGIVVQHGDGALVTGCVAFGGETITGEEVLAQSGIAWYGQTFGGFGVAVCALDGEPDRYLECPGKDTYWAVFVSRGGAAWQLSSVGISALSLGDGDFVGFRYVPVAGTPAPPALPGGACVAATPSPNGAAAATASASAEAPATATATTPATAAASAAATVSAAAATGVPADPDGLPASPAPPSGPDPGLLVAFAAGGGLAGLAVLRLVSAGRAGR